MPRHLLQRFLLTLPALWLVLALVFLMIHIGDTQQSVSMDKIRWYER